MRQVIHPAEPPSYPRSKSTNRITGVASWVFGRLGPRRPGILAAQDAVVDAWLAAAAAASPPPKMEWAEADIETDDSLSGSLECGCPRAVDLAPALTQSLLTAAERRHMLALVKRG